MSKTCWKLVWIAAYLGEPIRSLCSSWEVAMEVSAPGSAVISIACGISSEIE